MNPARMLTLAAVIITIVLCLVVRYYSWEMLYLLLAVVIYHLLVGGIFLTCAYFVFRGHGPFYLYIRRHA